MPENKIRIVFMGTPHFAAYILEHLINTHHTIVGVVTVADKPAGRGKKIQESAVKKVAISHHIKCLQPTNLKDPSFLESLSGLMADVFVVVAFRMLPKAVWAMPKKGTFNLHASLLPQYRGAAPINWAIINGETETGVSTFFIDEKIDTGAIIDQSVTKIDDTDTAGTLHDKLMESAALLVQGTLLKIMNETVQSKKQKEATELKEASKIFKEDCKINWAKSGVAIYNFIRGMSPYPCAWSYLHTSKEPTIIKITAAYFEQTTHSNKINSLIKSKKELKVALSDGYLYLTEIQLPGKKVMKVQELLNGLHLEENTYIS